MTKTDKLSLLAHHQNSNSANQEFKVSLIIPFFNSQDAANLVSRELLTSTKYLDFTWWLVDNGSTPIIEFPRDLPNNVMTLRVGENLNFGGVVKYIANKIEEGSFIGWLPGNGKVTIQDAYSWVKSSLSHGYPIAKATRVRANVMQTLKTSLASTFLSIVTRIPIHDPGGTPTLIHPQVRRAFFEGAPDGIEIEVYTLGWAHRKGLGVIRNPINYRERVSGKSSWRKGLNSELRMLVSFWSVLNKTIRNN